MFTCLLVCTHFSTYTVQAINLSPTKQFKRFSSENSHLDIDLQWRSVDLPPLIQLTHVGMYEEGCMAIQDKAIREKSESDLKSSDISWQLLYQDGDKVCFTIRTVTVINSKHQSRSHYTSGVLKRKHVKTLMQEKKLLAGKTNNIHSTPHHYETQTFALTSVQFLRHACTYILYM